MRPPRFIFVGVIGRRLKDIELKRRSIRDDVGVDFWASTPVCGPKRDHRDHASILPWALPLAGLSGTHRCIRPGSTPIDSSASGDPRPLFTSGRASPIRSWVFGVLPDRDMLIASVGSFRESRPCLRRSCGACSPSLQRIDGADALAYPDGFESAPGQAPCLRFRTFRDKR
jgi:hypothetical protein